MIDLNGQACMFKQSFIDDSLLALKKDGVEEYLLLINEKKFDDKLKTLNEVSVYLEEEYEKFNNDGTIEELALNDEERAKVWDSLKWLVYPTLIILILLFIRVLFYFL